MLSIVNSKFGVIKNSSEGVMYLITIENGDLVEVLDISALVDPCRDEMPGSFPLVGGKQSAVVLKKASLSFPSGGALPQCWLKPGYIGN
jgi:hypothetical protein